ncbi:MAG: hypothetical protein BGO68_05455 [Candidatus Amoebophilus sp. 36-38]|nr:MAG: hypothetical protein BGO68_05455 [Candidatus Amoebophilus sp. 36-38]
MKRYYKLTDRLIACALLLSLCLQSCDHSFNQLVPEEKEQADVILGSTKRIEIIKQLIEQKFISGGWGLKDLYEEQGELKAKVIEKHGDFTSKPHELSVAIAKDIDLEQTFLLSPEEQKGVVQFISPQSEQLVHVMVSKVGLAGGMKRGVIKKGDEEKEKEKEKEKEDREIKLTRVDSPIKDATWRRRYFKTSIPTISTKDAQHIEYIRELGSGGMGTVYQAVYQEDTIAVKKLYRLNREQIAAFKKEAIIIANLKHPNIISFLGFFQIPESTPFQLASPPMQDALIMEYASQGSLWSLLTKHQGDSNWDASWQLRYQIALDIAGGLSYLHQWDIVHCDLKSENILLDAVGRAKITDFGSAVLKSGATSYEGWAGDTWRWKSPELIGIPKGTKAGDVYSYGMLLWQLGTRREPFPNFEKDIRGLIKHTEAGNREDITEDTPLKIRELINTCWLVESERPAMKIVHHLLEEVFPACEKYRYRDYSFLQKEKEEERKVKDELTIQVHELEKEKEKGIEKEKVISAREQEVLISQVEKLKKELEEEKQKHDEKEKEKEKEKGSEASLGIVSVPKIMPTSVATVNRVINADPSIKKSNSTTTPAKKVMSFLPLPRPMPPIQKAVSLGNLDKVLELLKNGLDVNEHSDSKDRYTALHYAVIYNQSNIVQALLANGADVHVVDNEGNTPLHFAAKRSHKEVVALLIEKGANVNATTKYRNYTPLYVAAEHGHKEVVALLIEKGANINATNSWGDTPLDIAARWGYKDVVTLLLEKEANINAVNSLDYTPLHVAARSGHKEVVTLLIEKGANVNAISSWSYTPLHVAVWDGHKEIVAFLLEKGANINATDSQGDTPLHVAASGGHQEVVALLIEKGASINATDFLGDTPLMLAKQKNHTEIVKLLQQAGGH